MERVSRSKMKILPILLLAAFVALTNSAHAGLPQKLEKLIGKGKYSDAIKKGEKYLEKNPDAPDAEWVRSLVMKADYNLAKQSNTVEAFEAFEKKYSRSPYHVEISELKSKVFYNTITVPVNTVAAFRDFRARFPNSSLIPDVLAIEYELAWKETERKNTSEAWRQYCADYPQAPRKAEARRKEMELAWSEANQVGMIESIEAYLERYPRSPHTKNASDLICKLAWKRAQEENSVGAFQHFRNSYPKCAQADSARSKEIETAWNDAEAAGTIEAIELFLRDYKDSPFTKKASDLICAKAWKATQEGNSIDAYRKFRNSRTQCDETDSALAAETELAWEEAGNEDTWEAYRFFLNTYPLSVHRQEAKTREKNMWGFEAPIGPDEFEVTVKIVDDTDTENIHLYFQVVDSDGKMVGGLPRANFSVYENGCQAEIVDFQGMESVRPVDIVFLFDVSGSMADEINGVKEAIIQFAENLRLRNRDVNLGVVTFIEDVIGVYPKGPALTSNVQSFKNWIGKQNASGGGLEHAFAAVALATKKSFRDNAQVMFILITDEFIGEIVYGGTPVGSFVDDEGQEIIIVEGADPVWSYDQIVDMLNEQRIAIFVIAPDVAKHKWLAEETGGSLYVITEYPDFSELILHISNITAKQYHLVYRGTECGAEADERGVRVRARKDYTWVPAARLNVESASCMVVDKGNHDRSFMATRDAGMFRSTDGGVTWKKVAQSLGKISFGKIFATSKEGGKVLALSDVGKMYVGTEEGAKWEEAGKAPKDVLSVAQHPMKPGHLFASDGRAVFKSTDGGVTWEEAAPLGKESSSVSLSVDVSKGERVLALGSGKDASASLDGGKTWQQVDITVPEPGKDLASYKLFNHPNWKGNSFAVGQEGGFFRSVDSGSTWEEITPKNAGPDKSSTAVASLDLAFDPSKRHWMLLTTSDGVFASRDDGDSWFPLGEGVDDKDKKAPLVAIGGDGRIQFAGADTGNIYLLNPVTDREFVSGSVYFSSGSDKINKKLYSYLEDLVKHLTENPDIRVRIEGHTDDVGNDELNLELSLRRAVCVRDFLISKGIARSRIIVAGYGKTKPLIPNSNAQNRARNRRVEITLIGRNEPIPEYSQTF